MNKLTEKINKQREKYPIEQLADIEHQRWSHWQKYMHSKIFIAKPALIKKDWEYVKLPMELYKHWERQINTDYKDLTEKEKQSDRDQVNKYLPLIQKQNNLNTKELLETIVEMVDKKKDLAKKYPLFKNNRKLEPFNSGYDCGLDNIKQLLLDTIKEII